MLLYLVRAAVTHFTWKHISHIFNQIDAALVSIKGFCIVHNTKMLVHYYFVTHTGYYGLIFIMWKDLTRFCWQTHINHPLILMHVHIVDQIIAVCGS